MYETIPRVNLAEIFEAYFNCRANKRNIANALAFELDYESNLIKISEESNNGSYQISRSIAFIVNKPVKREIFAADFRDKVVHHYIINKLNPLFEQFFINDSYACRVGKGTHFGISRVNKFVKSCSENYTKDCYILKLDIQGFFMNIDKTILFERLSVFINDKYIESDKELIIDLCNKVIFNEPTKNCIIKGEKTNWEGLPNNKSLFYSPPNCGLPIGNFTSQVVANFYMNIFDHFIKKDLGLKYYGRYVDDFIIAHPDKEYLKQLLPIITHFLTKELNLTIHPKKIYLQHYTKGIQFLGTIIKPNRIYIANRTKGNFYASIHKHNQQQIQHFLSSINSYLGILKHYQTYRLRKNIVLKNLSHWWWKRMVVNNGFEKIGFQ